MSELTEREKDKLIIAALSELLKEQLEANELSVRIDEMAKGHITPNSVAIIYDKTHLDEGDLDILDKFGLADEYTAENGIPAISLNIETSHFNDKGEYIPMRGKMSVELVVSYTDKDWEAIKKRARR